MGLYSSKNFLHKLELYTPKEYVEHRPVNESRMLTKAQALELLRKKGYSIKADSDITD